jgi:hypothetical protein
MRTKKINKSNDNDISLNNEINIQNDPPATCEENHSDEDNPNSKNCENLIKIPKKRGRKPKGGKIIKQNINVNQNDNIKQNVILHLKCSLSEVSENIFSLGVTYDPNIVGNVDGYSFESKDLTYDYIKSNDKQSDMNVLETANNLNVKKTNEQHSSSNANPNNAYTCGLEDNGLSNSNFNESNQVKDIWKKLSELENLLHNNDVSDKKSACFWDTCDFDNPPIYIPKYELNGVYYVYGCFCSPECAAAYLMQENIDTASKFERYHLLNHIYCKIYNYKRNIKIAANPHYTLNKYYGNLTIQEYRKLLKNERLLLIVDKPLTRQLPELHQDNDDFIINNNSIPSASKYKLRRNNNKQSKNDILNEKFGVK